jgi:aspartate/tyrosine/aromatic aminotransferase
MKNPFKLELLPEDPIFGIDQAFKKDPRPNKINLVVGAYRDEEGKPWDLPSVTDAEKRISHRTREYLPIAGDPSFLQGVRKLFSNGLGHSLDDLVLFQTIGGAGALTLGGELIKRGIEGAVIHLPDPTWANHIPLFEKIGLTLQFYPYPDPKGIIERIEKLTEKDVFLLHLVCQNPTGIDPSKEEWEEIAEAFLKGKGIPFFDLAYLGFGAGVNEDLYPLKLFIKKKIPFLLALSCSKSFGLYNERVGALAYFVEEGDQAFFSQGKKIIRNTYSNPPLYGASLVAKILLENELFQQWEDDLKIMRHRMANIRKDFFKQLGMPLEGRGMFTLLPLKEGATEKLRDEKAIFLPKSGRISFAAINKSNCSQIVDALRSYIK